MKHNLLARGQAVELRDTPDDADDASQRFNIDLVLDHERLQESARAFAATEVVSVSHSADKKVLCVLQREYAVVQANVVALLGSDDATTCVMLFMRLGNAVACGHIDNCTAIGTQGCAVVEMHRDLVEAAPDAAADAPVQVWIVGGFCDDRNNSAATVGMLLAALNALPRPADLQLVFAERVNDRLLGDVHHPRYYGAVYSSADGAVLPAHFTHLGPAVGVRSALPACGVEELFSCYDWRSDEIRIYFQYSEFEAAAALLEAPDEFLLSNVSTSGEQVIMLVSSGVVVPPPLTTWQRRSRHASSRHCARLSSS